MVEIFLFKSGFFIQADISFSSWGFQLKARSFLFKLRCFNSSRNLFSSSWDVPIQVEIFSCRDFYFKSRIYFFMSRFLFQVEVFISCREFFHVDIFQFQEENFFFYLKSRFLFSSRSFKWTFLNSRREVTQEYLLASPGNDKSNKITWRSAF